MSLVDTVSQYEILLRLSRHLSYHDIKNLGRTDKDFHSLITSNRRIHRKLKGLATCSGAGLALRQRIMNNASTDQEDCDDDCSYIASEEENWDPDVNSRTCSPYSAQPCRRCHEPVCEACRSTPRTNTQADDLPRDPETGVAASPSKSFAGCFQYLVAYCTDCDPDTPSTTQSSSGPENGEAPTSMSAPSASVASADDRVTQDAGSRLGTEYCDCDRFTRWICHPCQEQEKSEYLRYTRRRFVPACVEEDGDGEVNEGDDHRAEDAMFLPWATAKGEAISMMLCLCGQPAHRMSHLHCFLCRRRHRSTGRTLQNGLQWRNLWFGKDEDWDEAWSM